MIIFQPKKVVLFLWILVGIVGFAFNGLSAKFSNSVILNPQIPSADQGLIIPFESKGRIVYINLEQQHYLSVLNRIEVSISVLAVLMFLLLMWMWKPPTMPDR
jgi:hypothetical protein